MARTIQLHQVPEEVNDSVYTSERYPLLVDPLGQACQFLKYRARYLSSLKRGDFERENLRKALVQALHNGAWLVLDFDQMPCDLDPLLDKEHFPAAVLSPHQLFLEENYEPLVRDSDEFAAKVTYEHQAALAQGAFQDRTKSHAPERVADVDSRFSPKEAFRLIVATRTEEAPPSLAERMTALKVVCSQSEVEENAGLWAGREQPKVEKSKEQQKLDSEMIELAFDGDLAQVQQLLTKAADPAAKDSHGNSALSEASCNGHADVARYLLEWKAPLGSDPNSVNIDGRTPLHRASFQGHAAVVQLLLEKGADPRLKDRHGEVPFDMASNEESQTVLSSWDVSTTDRLKETRQAAQEAEDEKNIRSEEERLQHQKSKKMQRLAELAQQGEKDELELEIMNIQHQIGSYRDDRGNNVLHIAVEHGRLDCACWLIDDIRMDLHARDAKGWTPVAIAAFRGHKRVCQALIARKADPLIENAYRKDALAVARDDEIIEVLKLSPRAAASAVSSSQDPGQPSAEVDEAAPKAKAKGKAKAKSRATSGSAEPRAKAKAAAKPRGKSRPR